MIQDLDRRHAVTKIECSEHGLVTVELYSGTTLRKRSPATYQEARKWWTEISKSMKPISCEFLLWLQL